MSKQLTIAPENLEVANKYLETGDAYSTAASLSIPLEKVTQVLEKKEVRRYVDNIFMDRGYRNRVKLQDVLDEIMESKLEEARESEMFTKKDILDVIQLIHKMKIEERKIVLEENKTNAPAVQNTTIIDGTPFGEGNYGKLMQRLMNPTEGDFEEITDDSKTR
jgi:hypothetical protein